MRGKLYLIIAFILLGSIVALYLIMHKPSKIISHGNDLGTGEKPVQPVQQTVQHFQAVSEDDCRSICERILICGVGPWQKQEDCELACDGAKEDEITSKTYDCISQATDCKMVAECGK